MLTLNNLKEKSETMLYSKWCGYDIYVRTASTNIAQISDNVFSFTEYNLLPYCENDILDGHYTFYVNVKTLDYLIYKSSDYGSLTYTLPSKDTRFKDRNSLPKETIIKVESMIANKLLGAYYSEYKTNDNVKRPFLDNGTCQSIICDYRGYLWCEYKPNERSDHDLTALKLIDKDFSEEHLTSVKYIGKKYLPNSIIVQFKINSNKNEYLFEYAIDTNYSWRGFQLTLNKKVISKDSSTSTNLKGYFKAINGILKSL